MPGTENPWEGLVETALVYGALAVAAGVVAGVIWFVPRPARPLLPLLRFRSPPWGGREVAVVFLILLTVPAIVYDFLRELGFYEAVYGRDPEKDRKILWASFFSAPLVLALVLMVLHGASAARSAQLGWSWVRCRANVVAGYLAWLPATPLVLSFFFLLGLAFTPEQHALEKVARAGGLLPVEWGVICFQAIVAAAVLEETIFRGVLQKWLVQATLKGHFAVALFGLVMAARSFLSGLVEFLNDAAKPLPNPYPVAFALLAATVYLLLARAVFVREVLAETRWTTIAAADDTSAEPADVGPEPVMEQPAAARSGATWLAILGSSYLFAVSHPDWPSPPALLLLALVLGWLAWRTGSLVPGVVLHGLFNAVACATFLLAR